VSNAGDPAPVASVDIGTNAVRCLIVDIFKKGTYRVREDLRFPVRLGEGLSRDGLISDSALARLDRAAGTLREIFSARGVRAFGAVGTNALRIAANAGGVLRMLRERHALPVRVVPPGEEARLGFLSARRLAGGHSGAVVMIDVGGGSTEFAAGRGTVPARFVSLNTGAVYGLERWLKSDPPQRREIAGFERETYAMLHRNRSLLGLRGSVPLFVGAGGTVSTVAGWLLGSGDLGHGARIGSEEIFRALSTLSRMNRQERIDAGIPSDRADVLVAGLVVLGTVLRYLSAKEIVVNGRGLREGIIISMLEDRGRQAAETP